MRLFIKLSLVFLVVIAAIVLYSKLTPGGEIDDTLIWTDTIPKEYSQFLKLPGECCHKLNENFVFVKTSVFTYRNPVSSFYINDKYYLQVYKMDSPFMYSLKNAIKDDFLDTYTQYHDRCSTDNRTDMLFLYKLTKPQKPKKIYFDLYGDSTIVLKKNDTIAYYHSKCVSFSIKFNPDAPFDIDAKCQNENFVEAPLEIIFLRRNDKLFMLILSVKTANTDLKRGTLYNLFWK